MNKIAIAALLMIASGAALAFDVDGYRSGMTPDDVAAIAQRQGLEMWQIANMPGDWAIGIRAQYRVDATLAFCAPTGLFAYAHSLDPDKAYLPSVERTIAAWGQPNVSVRRAPWSGPKGGDLNSIDMLWKRGDGTELNISFTPEGRDGAGAMRYNRGASISYIDRSRACSTR